MAELVMRDLDERLERRLREQAAARGHSIEDEARDILIAALDIPQTGGAESVRPGLGTRMAQRFAGLGARAEDFPELRGEEVKAATFE